MDNEHPVLVFDSVCNLCDGLVQWIIKRDPEALFRFTSLQSEPGKALATSAGLPPDELSTAVLVQGDRFYTKSDMALEVARLIGGFWRVLYLFKIVPRPLRNAVYDWVAKNRCRWFGQKDQCMVPTPELRSRFLD